MNSTKMSRMWLPILFATFCLGLWAQATPPGRVNFQGTVQSSAGTPLSGPVTMIFRLYDDPSAGTVLWQEAYDPAVYPPAVTATEGLFTVALGDPAHRGGGSEATFKGVFANHAVVYLGVQAGTDPEMTPRIQVAAAPFAENAGALDGKQASDFADATHTHAGSDITSAVANAAHADTAAALSATLVATQGGTGLGSPGAAGNVLTSNGTGWTSAAPPSGGSAGVVDAANGTLTRSGSGTGADPYKLALNLGSANAWSGAQTFGGNTKFPGSGIWDSTGKIGIGEPSPSVPLDIRGVGSEARLISTASDFGGVLELRNTTTSPAPTYLGLINFNDPASSWPGQVAYLASGNLTFRAAGLERMRISSTGVGIGTTAVVYGLRVESPGSAGTFIDTSTTGLPPPAVEGFGKIAGGGFTCTTSSGYANVGNLTSKIIGSGAVSFVQNHPVEKDKVIVYACPEGDEVATYTRGTARLVNGVARVRLGETFQWVTNPDIGLTAHLTPRGKCKGLYVESLSTTEMVVKELEDDTGNAAFDYLVYGLRIGFEESSIVQEKQQESYIPAFTSHRERYAKFPELRAFNAFERFKTMAGSVHPEKALDLSRAAALKGAVHEYDPATDPPVEKLLGHGHGGNPDEAAKGTGASVTATPQGAQPTALSVASSYGNAAETSREAAAAVSTESKLVLPCFPVSAAVEAGDVVVMDPARDGYLTRCALASDPMVVGIAAGTSSDCQSGASGAAEDSSSRVPVATTGVTPCKVDASFGPIHRGDLLVASPTPGRAMRAVNPAPGTVLGKALESLDGGLGIIQVLVMMR